MGPHRSTLKVSGSESCAYDYGFCTRQYKNTLADGR
jgi:hypothetical protein